VHTVESGRGGQLFFQKSHFEKAPQSIGSLIFEEQRSKGNDDKIRLTKKLAEILDTLNFPDLIRPLF
jgi:hypothetical protein